VKYTTRSLTTWDGPRTPADRRRSRWAFKAGWDDTLDLLDRELQHLGAREVVLEADFREQDLRLDGMPRSNARQPVDPAVRIAFDSKHGALVYAADTCAFWQHNVRSIALGLEALRAVDRYGISRRAEQYRGYRQIGGGPAVVPDAPLDAAAAQRIVRRAAAPYPAEFDQVGADLRPLFRYAKRNTHPDTRLSDVDITFDQLQRAIAVLEQGRP
jgi:hypothetical protein